MASIALRAVLLIGSNSFFLLPSIKAYRREMLYEGTIFLLMSLISALYHIADTIPNTHVIFDYYVLQFNDFYFAFNLIPVATLMIMFSTDKDETHINRIRNFKIKSVMWVILNLLAETLVRQGVDIYQMVLSLGGLSFLAGVISIVFWRESITIDIPDFVAMWIFLIAGILCFFLCGSCNEYWVWHSLWHMFVAIGMYFGIETGNKAWNIINFLTCGKFCKIPSEIQHQQVP